MISMQRILPYKLREHLLYTLLQLLAKKCILRDIYLLLHEALVIDLCTTLSELTGVPLSPGTPTGPSCPGGPYNERMGREYILSLTL